MFGLGFWEILMIALVIIVFVPPKDMPKVFSRIGKVYGEIRSFNRSVRNTMRTLELDVDREYRKAKQKEAAKDDGGNRGETVEENDTAGEKNESEDADTRSAGPESPEQQESPTPTGKHDGQHCEPEAEHAKKES